MAYICLVFYLSLLFSSLLFSSPALAQQYSDGLLKAWENRVPIPGNGCETGDNLCDELPTFEASSGFKIGTDETSVNTNVGIPSSGTTISNKNIEVQGTYRITLSVTFNNCTFKMHPNSRIIFENSTASNISFYFCQFFSCDQMWEGIRVENSAASNLFIFSGCRIEDAFKALTIKESGVIAIVNTEFYNNFIGITNLKQNGTSINCTIRGNTFKYTNAGQLRPLTGKMLSDIAMFNLIDCGIYFANTSATIGSPTLTSYINLFTCMTTGIWVVNSSILSRNNHFTYLGIYAGVGTGILAENGSLRAKDKCYFKDINSGVGIQTSGANLFAENNDFQGDMFFGIESKDNDKAEEIDIHFNRMNLTGPNCYIGIAVDRSNGLGGPLPSYTMVNDNNIYVSLPVTNTFPFSGISVGPADDATDEVQIFRDTIHIDGVTGEANGITVDLGYTGDNFHIEDNNIRYSNTPNLIHESHGIEITSYHPLGGVNHRVRNNYIYGTTGNFPVLCGIHTVTGNNIEYCNNTIDDAYNGIHFGFDNAIQMRENSLNRHYKGLWINSTNPVSFPNFIGVQTRRGNTWDGMLGDYLQYTADCDGCIDPTLSRFFIEVNTQPLFPFPSLLNPPISGSPSDWFRTINGDLDYCEGGGVKLERSAYETEVMDGTSGLPAASEWDWQRLLLTRQYFYPNQEPGDLEQSFYAGLAGSSAEAYAGITKRIIDAQALTPAQYEAVHSYRSVIRQKMQEWEALTDAYASDDPFNPSQEYVDAVQALFPSLEEAARQEQEWENVRNAEKREVLLAIRADNEALAAENAWENARKLLNRVTIHHLLGESTTEADYAALLEVAGAEPEAVGKAKMDVLSCLYPWDAAPYKAAMDHPEAAERNQTRADKQSGVLQVAPNPTSGVFTLSLPGGTKDALLRIFNASGTLVSERSVHSDAALTVDLNRYPAGLYTVLLQDHETGAKYIVKITVQL